MNGKAESRDPTESEAPVAVSVIIPHYQDLANLDHCLTLLGRQTFDPRKVEIVIADNASPVGLDAVRNVVGDRARVVLSTVKGAGVTRNVGVSESRGRIIAFIDSDCRPEPTFLEEGIRMLEKYNIVGGHIRVEIEVPNRPTAAEAFELVFAFQNENYIRNKRFSVTAALLVPRAIFSAVGPFCNDISEDLEWCNRATSMGYTLGFARAAVVGHPARRTWAELVRKWRRLTSEGFGLIRARKFGRLRWLARAWLVLAATIPHLVKIAASDRLQRWRDRLGAMGVLVRLRFLRFVWAHTIVFEREDKRN